MRNPFLENLQYFWIKPFENSSEYGWRVPISTKYQPPGAPSSKDFVFWESGAILWLSEDAVQKFACMEVFLFQERLELFADGDSEGLRKTSVLQSYAAGNTYCN